MLSWSILTSAALAQSPERLRLATFAAPLSRDGPGLLLRDIARGEDAQVRAIVDVIDHTQPDVLLLTDFDHDATLAALTAFSAQLETPFPFLFSRAPNAGTQTGLDVDGDGRAGDARDALGYGRFRGDGGLAILSRYPIAMEEVMDLTGTLWRDVPGATLPTLDGAPFPSAKVHDHLPVSSTSHWIVPIDVNGTRISLLAFSATPPVFDGVEDFNGLRNRDELRLMQAVLDGAFGPVPERPVLMGNVNADPADGEGLRDVIAAVLTRADLQDPQPASAGAAQAADTAHTGDPALDTADWDDGRPGNLRVSYVLPSNDLRVAAAGVFWPAPDDANADILGDGGMAAGPHRLVWVDVLVTAD